MNILLCTVLVAVCLCASAFSRDVDHEDYLKRFGYLNTQVGLVASEQDISKAIMDFQAMAGIEPTGTMDAASYEMMSTPRCGNVDRAPNRLQRRIRRYTLMGTKWGHMKLTFKITKYTRQLSHKDTDAVAFQSFKFWGECTPLTFRQVLPHQKADIDIRFVRGAHGDGFPFNWQILAHAFQPEYGMVHFNDAMIWVIGNHTYGKYNMVQVMTHEFGHSLGMDHSYVKKSAMTPYYKGYEKYFALDLDDVRGIQSMYGRGGSYPDPTPRITTTSSPSNTTGDICTNPTFDAITFMDGRIYGFRGSEYYMIQGNKQRIIHKPISELGIEVSDVDAVVNFNKRTYFIKGTQVYAVEKKAAVAGFPKTMDDIFPGVPEGVTAAFTKRGDLYFVVTNKYYRVNLTNRVRSSQAVLVPCPFKNCPNRVEAAFEWPYYAIFFFNNEHYQSSYGGVKMGMVYNTKDYWVQC